MPEISNLVGHWKCNDNEANTTVVDSAGSNNLTFSDAGGDPNTDAHTVAGKINTALDFDGIDDTATNGSPTGLPSGASARSYVFWFNADSFDTALGQPIISFAAGTSFGRSFHIYAEDNAVSIGLYGHRIITPKSTLLTATWYHVVVVVPTGSSKTTHIVVYINTVSQPLTNEIGRSRTLNTTNTQVDIGNVGGDYFDGRVDDIRIYTKALSADEMSFIYNGGAGTESNNTDTAGVFLNDGFGGLRKQTRVLLTR